MSATTSHKSRNLSNHQLNNNWKPTTVLISGSGMQVCLNLGCLKALEEQELTEVKVWVGTSTCAIVALLLSCDYTITEIIDLIIPHCNRGKLTDLGTVTQVLIGQGLILISEVREWLEKAVLDRCGSVPSLKGLYLQNGKSFCVTTLTREGVEVLSWQTHPRLSCVEACLRAISVPYVFTHTDSVGGADAFLALPSPVEYFDDEHTHILNLMVDPYSSEPHVVNTGQLVMSLSDPTSSALQTLNSLIRARQSDCVDRTSEAVRHVMLSSYTPDPIGYSADAGRLLADGFMDGWHYLATGYLEPEISVPRQFSYSSHS